MGVRSLAYNRLAGRNPLQARMRLVTAGNYEEVHKLTWMGRQRAEQRCRLASRIFVWEVKDPPGPVLFSGETAGAPNAR